MYISLTHCEIRTYSVEDAESLTHHANNVKIWRHLRDGFPHPYTLQHAEQFIQIANAQQPCRFFAIANETGVIGSIGFTPGEDVERYSAEMGYWLAESYWRRGIMTEVVLAFTQYIFDHHPMNRAFATPYATNAASSRVLEKAGFLLEGRLESAAYKAGQFTDKLIYAKLNNAFTP